MAVSPETGLPSVRSGSPRMGPTPDSFCRGRREGDRLRVEGLRRLRDGWLKRG